MHMEKCANDCKDARKKSQKVLLTSQITTTKNLNTTRAPRQLKPQRMYRLHAQTNVKKTTRVVQIKMSVASYVVHSQITSDNLHASAPFKVRKRLWRKTIGALFQKMWS
jgi:hypothetical protein